MIVSAFVFILSNNSARNLSCNTWHNLFQVYVSLLEYFCFNSVFVFTKLLTSSISLQRTTTKNILWNNCIAKSDLIDIIFAKRISVFPQHNKYSTNIREEFSHIWIRKVIKVVKCLTINLFLHLSFTKKKILMTS